MPIKYTVEDDDDEKVAAESGARIQTDEELLTSLKSTKTATGALLPTGVNLGQTMRQNNAEKEEVQA